MPVCCLHCCLQPPHLASVATDAGDEEPAQGSSREDLAAAAHNLNQLLSADRITGPELRQLVLRKWGRSFDVRLHKRGGRMCVCEQATQWQEHEGLQTNPWLYSLVEQVFANHVAAS